MDLQIEPNGDGTVTATISGGSPGAVNTVYCVRVNQAWNDPLSWSAGGTRTGNGTVTVTTGAGCYWFYAGNDTPVASVPVYAYVTSERVDVWRQIMEQVQSKIRHMQLPGVESGNVTWQQVIDEQILKSGGPEDGPVSDRVLIACQGPESLASGGVLQRDDWEYPVLVCFVSAQDRNQSPEQSSRWMLIRERIRQAFSNLPLALADGVVWKGVVKPFDPVLPYWWNISGLVVSSMQITFTSREPRGM